MKMNRISKYVAAAGLCGALLAGCGMAPTTAQDGSVGFPARDGAWLKEGTFVNVENLRQIGPGPDKNQVYALIGEPHFSEGIFGVHVWNYVFNFRTGHGQDVVTCQYQIQYDSHYRVKSTYWKEPECKALVDGPKEPPVAQAASDESKQFTLDYHLLFPFDKSALRDLLPSGRAELDRIAATLQQQYQHIRSVRVTGYTDRLGTDEYNRQLSLARAETIRSYLTTRGLPGDLIVAQGLGKADPVSAGCPAGRSSEAIACLAPDRRVRIDVAGERR
ncbi:hypothetical protein WS62_26110 [Burkholderia sp. ABCPW 14]|uniref:OmpA family protein n=1 Tax=Burkholderia sp. ABCPW 14 TaxID=1637860 RepID=UPI000770C9EE|nr:OmpA family protein [Burkholderia sp. ABCPW 14]KVD80796.1 hypothetical protein WS62_26110 [Burkholderia sp. ABCPW 14]